MRSSLLGETLCLVVWHSYFHGIHTCMLPLAIPCAEALLSSSTTTCFDPLSAGCAVYGADNGHDVWQVGWGDPEPLGPLLGCPGVRQCVLSRMLYGLCSVLAQSSGIERDAQKPTSRQAFAIYKMSWVSTG